MHLEQGLMTKRCFITTAHVWAVPLSFLRGWTTEPFKKRLDQESFGRLLEQINLSPLAQWIETDILLARLQNASDPIVKSQIAQKAAKIASAEQKAARSDLAEAFEESLKSCDTMEKTLDLVKQYAVASILT